MNWLLLRGLTRQAGHWGGFRDDVSKEFKGETLALDLPGFGTASHVKSPLSMPQIVEHLRPQFLEKRSSNSSSSWNLLGLSFGGMVALEWLRLYPKDFDHGIIVNSSLAGLCTIQERMSLEAKLVFIKCVFGAEPDKKESMILGLTSSLHQADKDLLASWLEIEGTYPTKIIEGIKQLLISSRFKGPESLTVPILVLSSQMDRLVDPVCSKKISEKYKVRNLVHPEAGHDLPLDAPHWVTQKMREFVSRQ
jgi:pimeloyl-ACP methyl ester carboxylesterase